MRKLILAAVMATAAPPIASPAPAAAQGAERAPRDARDCRHDLRNARSRREYHDERRDCAPRHQPGPQPRLAQLSTATTITSYEPRL